MDGDKENAKVSWSPSTVVLTPPSRRLPFPTLVRYPERTIDNHMANWKVIETVSGNIEAVSGHDAHGRPGKHEFLVWGGEASDKAEALHPTAYAASVGAAASVT